MVDKGFVGVIPLPSSPAPRITPAGALGIYAIRDRATGAASMHLAFPVFAQTLNALLGQGATVRTVAALGAYDGGTNETGAFLVGVVVE